VLELASGLDALPGPIGYLLTTLVWSLRIEHQDKFVFACQKRRTTLAGGLGRGAKPAVLRPRRSMRGRRIRWGNVARLGAVVAIALGAVAALPSLLADPEPPPPEPDVGLAMPAEPPEPLVKEKAPADAKPKASKRERPRSPRAADPEPDGPDHGDQPEQGNEGGHRRGRHSGSPPPAASTPAQSSPAPGSAPPAAVVPPPVETSQPNPAGLEFGP
jgi:hypothetical protein